MRKKPTVAVLFGGRSAEHEVSLVSAKSVFEHLDRNRYELLEVGISPDGAWFCGPGTMDMLLHLSGAGESVRRCCLTADPTVGGLLIRNGGGDGTSLRDGTGRIWERQPVDMVFIVLHGTFGEDGTVQGALEMAGIPYTGASAAASALSFDKDLAKQVWTAAGLPVVPWVTLHEHEFAADPEKMMGEALKTIGFPCFVKPARSGSSVGVSRVDTREGVIPACGEAFRFDRKILLEPAIDGREVECAVLGNESPRTAIPGEVIPSGAFYDYAAKYLDGLSETVVPARLPDTAMNTIRETAISAYRANGCEGMARVDFFYQETDGLILLNEVNTIPGFTPISMYPMMWEATGLPYPALLDELIRLGFERHHTWSGRSRLSGLSAEEASRVGQAGPST